MSDTNHSHQHLIWPAVATAGLRVAFGIIWAVGAALTWMPGFADHYVGYLHNAAQGQPVWSAWWFSMWIAMVTPHALLFTWLTRFAVTATAIALLTGLGGRTLYLLGALFSLLIWSTAEGFGGPYTVGVSNISTAITYVLIFLALIGLHYRAGFVPYSLDYLLEKRWPRWQRIAEWSKSTTPPSEPVALPAGAQITAIGGIIVLLALLIAGIPSTLNVKTASPETAASAVSPLMLADKGPIEKAHNAKLPPVAEGDDVTIHVVSTDEKVTIAKGVSYQAWTFGGTVPGPVYHVRQGQTITLKFTNKGTMEHSVDFHAAITPPNLDYVDIKPGQTLTFSFKADTPGAFVYHCGTPPVLLHMANGMYGAIIVDPKDPLPKAEASYVIVQSEWYTQQLKGKLMAPDYKKMMEIRPDEVVFNGVAFQYQDQPLPIKAGERARIYFVNAGPSLWSAFHVIGGMFDKVYPDADKAHALSGVSTYSVAPGQGAVFDVILDKPGKYAFVDHSFAHLMKGAAGLLDVQPTANTPEPTLAKPNITQATPAETVADTKEETGPYTFNEDKGASLYQANCAACHQASGTGLPGAFPPLKDDPVVTDADASEHIDTVLHGAHGREINGTTYASPMPPFATVLSDREIADVINHERTSWGNSAKLVTADDVAAAR